MNTLRMLLLATKEAVPSEINKRVSEWVARSRIVRTHHGYELVLQGRVYERDWNDIEPYQSVKYADFCSISRELSCPRHRGRCLGRAIAKPSGQA